MKAIDILQMFEKKFEIGEGTVVIINPKISGSDGGVGIVKDPRDGKFMIVKNFKTMKTHSFAGSDIRHLDDPRADEWITPEIEKILNKM